MLKGKMYGVIAEYSTSGGVKKTIITFDSDCHTVRGVWDCALSLCLEHEGKADVFVGCNMIPTDSFVDLMLHSESEV